MTPASQNRAKQALLAVACAGLAAGLGFHFGGRGDIAGLVWTAGVVPVLAALLIEIVRSLRRREFGLDIVAALSMAAALAVHETLAAAVVAVMYAGGTFLEAYADSRARRELRDLLRRVPRSATLHRNGQLEDVALEAVAAGDLLLVRQGDVVPVDGTLASARALLDQSALTGEAMPVRLRQGQEVMSGSTNAGAAFDLRATLPAHESTYAAIVRLVDAAQRSKAPMTRLADRYAMVFLLVTVALASLAWWLAGDPVRGVAVLVVATPCPLILAVPVALVSGVSRAARFGVLVKGAKPLEAMARVHTLILDKTGTLTDGRPQIAAIHPLGAFTRAEVLRLAAALDQGSQHPIAQAVVAAARTGGAALPVPTDVAETPGEGLAGCVEGQQVLVGGVGFVAAGIGTEWPDAGPDALTHAGPDAGPGAGPDAGAVHVALAVDGRPAGLIVMTDVLRPGIAALLAGLRRQGVARILLATGDRRSVAEAVTRDLPLDAVHAEMTPAQKVQLVLTERAAGPVMMVGDGVNDAPALAAADIGVAMGARGAAASAEAADAVLLVDRLDSLLAGLVVARGARRIALQSVVTGLGLSLAGMVAAALGYLPPVQGAILQEAIDVVVILNALRALRIRQPGPAAITASDPRCRGGSSGSAAGTAGPG